MNTEDWGRFSLDGIFIISGTKTTKKSELIKEGNFPYITTKATNNGVDGNYDIWTEPGGVFVVESAVAGFMSYQEMKFSASDHVEKLTPKFKVTKNIADFICSVWNKSKMTIKYNYGLKASQRMLKKESILLPKKNDGSIDFEYIEEYMEGKRKEVILNAKNLIPKIKSKQAINISKWGRFIINDFFEIYSSRNSLDKNKIIKEGTPTYNYITRTKENNGINLMVPKQNVEINKGNCITIGLDTQTVFYQSDDFYTGQNVHILRHDEFEKEHYMFLCSILEKSIRNIYNWGDRGATLGRLKKQEIFLPVNSEGVADLKYMSDFIKEKKEKILDKID